MLYLGRGYTYEILTISRFMIFILMDIRTNNHLGMLLSGWCRYRQIQCTNILLMTSMICWDETLYQVTAIIQSKGKKIGIVVYCSSLMKKSDTNQHESSKKHLKQVGKEQKRSRGRVCMMAQQVMAPAISSDSWAHR